MNSGDPLIFQASLETVLIPGTCSSVAAPQRWVRWGGPNRHRVCHGTVRPRGHASVVLHARGFLEHAGQVSA